jgi:hypothetical protein
MAEVAANLLSPSLSLHSQISEEKYQERKFQERKIAGNKRERERNLIYIFILILITFQVSEFVRDLVVIFLKMNYINLKSQLCLNLRNHFYFHYQMFIEKKFPERKFVALPPF